MSIRIINADVFDGLGQLPDASVNCCVTSPPYFGLRDYGMAGQIGLEPTPDEFIAKLVAVFREVRRVLTDDGTCWVNMGDSYAGGGGHSPNAPSSATSKSGKYGDALKSGGIKPAGEIKQKDLIGIPWMLAFALRSDGWYLRQDIIWHKPNPMPESVTDRCTKSHEYVFLLTKSARYWYDAEAISEPALQPVGTPTQVAQHKQAALGANVTGTLGTNQGSEKRNRRSVWPITTQPFSDWTETVRQVRVEADAPLDGKKRKASPDCPVHGDQDRLVSNASCDEHEAGMSPHSARNDDHPVPLPLGDCAPIARNHAQENAEQSSGSPRPGCVPSAMPRSTEAHKTDLVPETSPACTVSAQSRAHTADSSASTDCSGSAGHMLGNNIAEAGMGDSPASQSRSRNAHSGGEQASFSASHDSNCTCEYYIEKVEKTSHFATFPPELPELCIKAGCPKGGTVLDPFFGAGTTGLVADRLGRNAIGIELNPEYAAMARKRIQADAGMFGDVA